jgi:hypothetical protein
MNFVAFHSYFGIYFTHDDTEFSFIKERENLHVINILHSNMQEMDYEAEAQNGLRFR